MIGVDKYMKSIYDCYPSYIAVLESLLRWYAAIETLSALLAVCEGIHGAPVNSPWKRWVIGSFDVFFVVIINLLNTEICRWFDVP